MLIFYFKKLNTHNKFGILHAKSNKCVAGPKKPHIYWLCFTLFQKCGHATSQVQAYSLIMRLS